MEQYWANRPKASMAQTIPLPTGQDCQLSEFDRHRRSLIMQEEEEHEGWAAELRRYLKAMPADVSKDTDIVEWWQVVYFFILLW
jgi:hypothetical protein